MIDERHVLAHELPGDDLADPPEAADDEVLVDVVEHAFAAAADPAIAEDPPPPAAPSENENVYRTVATPTIRSTTVKTSP